MSLKTKILIFSATVLLGMLAVLFFYRPHFTFEPSAKVPLTRDDFFGTDSYQVDYNLYFYNAFGGWQPNDDIKMHYQVDCRCYQINGIDITASPVDSWGTRFKIASENWQHEFSFARAHDTVEQAKFGITTQGTIIALSNQDYAADMYFELPPEAKAARISAQLKILSASPTPKAWLRIWFDSKPSEVDAN